MIGFVAVVVVVVDSGCLMGSCDVGYCGDYSWCWCCCCRSSRSLVLMVRCSFALIAVAVVVVVEGVEIYIHGSIVGSLFLDFSVLIVRILL